MTIHLELYANVRAAAGVAALNLELPDLPDHPTLGSALSALALLHGETMRSALFNAEGRLQPGLLFAIGQKILDPSSNPTLAPGDTLTILPAISGG